MDALDILTKDAMSHRSQKITLPTQSRKRSSLSVILLNDRILMLFITLIALILRTNTALQLDVVTDEVVYILGGKIYLPLIQYMNIGSSDWSYNYEHPPLVKLLIGLSIHFNALLGHPLSEPLAARLPSIIFGALLVLAVYGLGRAPFGRVIALLAALSLAASPWLVYFSALAYLDMTMTALITIAYLLLWHAIQRPWLYPLSALFVGLGAASKYTATLVIPSMVLFIAYYFLALRPRLPIEQRPKVPWLWWFGTIVFMPLVFIAADPAIWPSPIDILLHSFNFEWEHSQNGHLTFIAGQYGLHAPHWAILYMLFVKISAFVTIPAICFVIFALIQLARFHFRSSAVQVTDAVNISFLLIWLLASLEMFSLLNIAVGTHYYLPLAVPVTLAGAYGLTTLLRYRRGSLLTATQTHMTTVEIPQAPLLPKKIRLNPRAVIVLALLTTAFVGAHFLGLMTIPTAEGYASEFFQGENTTLQVAYPGYRDAVQWLAEQTNQPAQIGLVALPWTLNANPRDTSVSWYAYNKDLPKRFQMTEAHPNDQTFPFDYLIWPMHLVQRGYLPPNPWRSHVVHVITGGNTIYCYIMSR